MDIKVFDRVTKRITIEKEKLSLKFLYNTILGRIILKYILIKPWCSKFNSIFIKNSISKLKIKSFIKNNDIDMSIYEKKKYKSFDDFFVRKIKEDSRKISMDNNILVSPCDSTILSYDINNNQKIKIKNSIYTVNELIKNDELAKEYQNGKCLVFRLSVSDYHHYCYIDDGDFINSNEIDGVLHSVRPISFKKYKTFSENNRIINILDTKNFGKVIYIEVGALNIGKINNIDKKIFKRGEEKGYFSFGASTIVLLFKENTINIDTDIVYNSNNDIETKVLYGESIGNKE